MTAWLDDGDVRRIRKHLERIVNHTGEHWPSCQCIHCLNYRDAQAALEIVYRKRPESEPAP